MASQRLLGDWIRRRRADLNLTQELLAEQVGCAVDTIRALETGRRRASQPMAERLATVLHIPLDERAGFLAAAQAAVQTPSASVVPDEPGKAARVAGQSTPVQTPALVATKLYRPRQTQAAIVRSRLIERLDEGLAGPLTLISAPAGFGKTTLVAHQIEHLAVPSAWLALDAHDDAPETFLRYVVAALHGIDSAIGAQLVPLLELSDSVLPYAVIDALLNDLAALGHDSVLVLDDLHVLTHPAIYDALAYLLDHLPPQLHLVLLTREDPPLPLARLRARRQLVELRAADLRFTLAEADAFLHQAMHLSLEADAIAALVGRTEGWIVGLQLAALSLRDLGAQDVATAIDAFTGNNRYVVDYLVDEVIRAQPAHLQHFLLQTSILDRLCAPLCDAIVLGDAPPASATPDTRNAAYSQSILEALEQANLFVVPLDSARHWYRYHQLFAEVLQTRLVSGAAPEQIRQLRQRASAWCEQEGLLAEAVQYVLAAHDWERAATLVERLTPAMIQRSELARLLTWLDTLPEDAVQARPRLALYYGWVLFLSGQMTQAAARLSATEAMLEADTAKQTPELQGHIAAIRAYLARLAGDFAVAIALSRQALADLPEQDTLLQAAVTFNLAIAHYFQGEFEPASHLLTEAIARVQTTQPIAYSLSAIYLKAQLLRAQGALQQALQLCQEGLALVARRGWRNIPAVGFLYVAFGDVLRERNELTTAAEYLEKGIELGQAGGHPHIVISGNVWLAWLRQSQGDVAGSTAAMHAALEVVRQKQVSRFWPIPPSCLLPGPSGSRRATWPQRAAGRRSVA